MPVMHASINCQRFNVRDEAIPKVLTYSRLLLIIKVTTSNQIVGRLLQNYDIANSLQRDRP